MAGGDGRKIVVDIVGDASKFTKTTDTAVKSATTSLGRLDSVLKKMSASGGIGGALLGGVGIGAGLGVYSLITKAIGTVTDYLGDSLQAAKEDALSVDRLTASLKANVEGWNGNTDAIEASISAKGRLGFADDALRDSFTRIIAVTHDVNEAIRVQNTAVDLARFKQIDLGSATDALIKVEAGQYRGLKALGIQLKAGATQTEALAAVQKVAAGQAEAYAKTSIGRQEALNVKMGELSETVGKFLVGPADAFVGWLSDVVDSIDGPQGADQAIENFITAQRKLAGATGQTSDWLTSFHDGLVALDDILQPQVDEALDFARSIQKLGEASGTTGREIEKLFFFLKDEKALGSAGAKAGVIQFLKDMIVNSTKLQSAQPAVHGFFQTFSNAISNAIPDFEKLKANFHALPPAIEHDLASLTGIVRNTMKDARNEAKVQMAKFIWDMEHPLAGERLGNFYEKQIKAHLRRLKRGQKAGNDLIIADETRFVAYWQGLLAGLQGDIEVVASLRTYVRGGRGHTGAGTRRFGFYEHGHPTNIGGHHRGSTSFGPSVSAGPGGGPGINYNVVVNVAPGGDLAEAGRQMTVAIRAHERRGGANWRSAA